MNRDVLVITADCVGKLENLENHLSSCQNIICQS